MAGFFGLFDYTKAGPGIEKNAPVKNRFFVFFEVFFRKFWKLSLTNLIFCACLIPILAVCYGLIMLFGALSAENPLFVILCLLPLVLLGPVVAGIMRLTRDFAREEPVFLWADFVAAVKNNFKPSLIIALFQYLAVILLFVAVPFYYGMITPQHMYSEVDGIVSIQETETGREFVITNEASGKVEKKYTVPDGYRVQVSDGDKIVKLDRDKTDTEGEGNTPTSLAEKSPQGAVEYIFGFVPFIFAVFACMILLFMSYYIYTMQVTLDLTLKKLFKNAAIFSFLCVWKNFLITILIAVVSILFLIILLAALPITIPIFVILVAGIYFSLIFFIISFITYPSIKRYIVDPYYAQNPEETAQGVIAEVEGREQGDEAEAGEERPKSEYVYENGRMVHRSVIEKELMFKEDDEGEE